MRRPQGLNSPATKQGRLLAPSSQAKDVGLFIVAIFLPPLAVFLAKEGHLDKVGGM